MTNVNEMYTALPTTSSSQLTDIICAVQGYIPSVSSGTSQQQTLSQIIALAQSQIILSNHGNPNGFVSGTQYQLCWDITNSILYVCTTSGIAPAAVWTTILGPFGVISATGINFGGSTLSTYSTNTFVPVFTFATPGNLSVVYSTQVGEYTQIGNVVHYRVSLAFTPTFTTSSGAINITGLSVPAGTTPSTAGSIVTNMSSGFTWPSGTTFVAPIISSTTLALQASGSATNSTALTTSSIVSGVALTLTFSGAYFSS